MPDREVCLCVDCGVPVGAHKRRVHSGARCQLHEKVYLEARKESHRAKRRVASKKYRERIKLNCGTTSYDCVCLTCSTEFKGRSINTKLCSNKCVKEYNTKKMRGRTVLRECVDCRISVEVSWAVPSSSVRCDEHRESHSKAMKDRRRTSKRNVKRVEVGQAPYDDYIVIGPVWCSHQLSYGWRVTAKHKSNSNRREMSLAHYNLSVKLGRRVQTREAIVFLDDDVDNCNPLNLLLETENKRKLHDC